jgi:hypothetical protein
VSEPLDIAQCPAALIVFAMESCPMCHEYVPRLLARVEAYRASGAPLVVHDEGDAVPPGSIPVLIYDVAAPDPALQALATQFEANSMPATIALVRGHGAFKSEGSLGEYQIDQLLDLVTGR